MSFLNRPKKLIVTSVLNNIGKQSSKFANAGASLALLYYFTKTIVSYTFDEGLQYLTEFQKSMLFGFLTGALYKCSRGLYPALLAGSLTGLAGGAIYKYKNKNKPSKESKKIQKPYL